MYDCVSLFVNEEVNVPHIPKRFSKLFGNRTANEEKILEYWDEVVGSTTIGWKE